MSQFTITFEASRIATLEALIVAAGKSPATNVQTMVAAADMLVWLSQQIDRARQDAAGEARPKVVAVNGANVT